MSEADFDAIRRSAGLADFQCAERAGYTYESGVWKRCSDLRTSAGPNPKLWTEWLLDDNGRSVMIPNPNSKSAHYPDGHPVGIAIVTAKGVGEWMDWLDAHPGFPG